MSVFPLYRHPAYEPMGPPVQCMTPGHEDITLFPARRYPGGRRCEKCLERKTSSDEKR